jgi:hypothetical protein
MSELRDTDPQPRPVESEPLTLRWDLRQGLPELHLAVFGVVLTIGLTVGFGIQAAWPIAVSGGIAASVLVMCAFRFQRTRALIVWAVERILY